MVLQDGTAFEGQAFGAETTGPGQGVGELVFTTGMCGYIETLTDPSYYGQIVMQTFPLTGRGKRSTPPSQASTAARSEICDPETDKICTMPVVVN